MTEHVGVIGNPIAHSLSPTLHNTAFKELGLDWTSGAILVRHGEQEAARVPDFMRERGYTGLSVTMPLKTAMVAVVDTCSDTARRLNAINCLINRDGAIRGENTDGEGFLASLERGASFSPADRRCVVLGAGGAARAVILALAEAGASEVWVINRTVSRAQAAAALAGDAGRVVVGASGGEPGGGSGGTDAQTEAVVAQADLVVNATPQGMGTSGIGVETEWPVDPSLLHHGQVVADLIYVPRPTPWLKRSAEAGATPVDGLGMLVHQAAAQITLWTGRPAPVEAMWRAVEEGG